MLVPDRAIAEYPAEGIQIRLPARRTMVASGIRRAASIMGTPTDLAHLRFPTHPMTSMSAMLNTLSSRGSEDKTPI